MRADRLKQFFTPMVRRAFWELGLGEHEIIDYVSDVLSGVARTDHLYRLRSVQSKPIDSVVEMRGEAMPAD
jgi:hypothetical protein